MLFKRKKKFLQNNPDLCVKQFPYNFIINLLK